MSGYSNASSLQKPTIQVSNPEIHWNIYRSYFSISKTTVLKSLFIKFASKLCEWRKLQAFMGFRNSPGTLGKTEINGLLAFQELIVGIIKDFSKKFKQIGQRIISEKAVSISSEIYVQCT